jgi:hypothetical protein
LCGQLATKRIRRDVVDEGALAVDLDHRQPLAIPSLELWIAADVDLLELERDLGARRHQHLAGAPAEVAPGGVEERDPRYG